MGSFFASYPPALSPTFGGVNVAAPAKINLSLTIHGKRADGFHEIETWMAPLTLADTLEVSLTPEPGLALTCSDASLPTGEGNLVFRAARRFFEASGRPEAARIHLEKRIPHGAGLGGGSSDAAATLRALNELCGHPLPPEALHSLAAELGSDVPFFLTGGAALCRGRGEQIAPRPLPGSLPLLLAKPGFGIPTPWAYGRWSASRELPGIPYAPQAAACGPLVNDLERPVFEKHLILAILKRWLMEQPECAGALLSGSGATCFALLHEEAGGPVLEERLRHEFGQFWTCCCRTA